MIRARLAIFGLIFVCIMFFATSVHVWHHALEKRRRTRIRDMLNVAHAA